MQVGQRFQGIDSNLPGAPVLIVGSGRDDFRGEGDIEPLLQRREFRIFVDNPGDSQQPADMGDRDGMSRQEYRRTKAQYREERPPFSDQKLQKRSGIARPRLAEADVIDAEVVQQVEHHILVAAQHFDRCASRFHALQQMLEFVHLRRMGEFD